VGTQRAHIVLPEELVAEIDSLVGPRGRSAFIVETAQAELRRRRLLAFLENPDAAWHDVDHPELSEGTESWVRKTRLQGDKRLPRRVEEKQIIK
jgi:hypothetical protein